jgi:hypothetical protein
MKVYIVYDNDEERVKEVDRLFLNKSDAVMYVLTEYMVLSLSEIEMAKKIDELIDECEVIENL